MSDKRVLLHIYDMPSEVRDVSQRLSALGIDRERISMVSLQPDPAGGGDGGDGGDIEAPARRASAAGAVGGSMGGLLATLGLAAIPGAGWVLAAGPVAALLVGATASGGVGAGLGYLLAKAGFEQEQSSELAQALTGGAVLVYVDPPPGLEAEVEEALAVEHVMAEVGAEHSPAMGHTDAYGRDPSNHQFGRPVTVTISG